LHAKDTQITPELESLFLSFQKCLDLRDKYIRKSRQRLGDNPRDHDGHFRGIDDDMADVSGVRPDADYVSFKSPPVSPFAPWHPTNKETVVKQDNEEEKFKFEDCPIPGCHPWCFEIDDKGVYQVYEDEEGEPSYLLFVPCVFVLIFIQSRAGNLFLMCPISGNIFWIWTLSFQSYLMGLPKASLSGGSSIWQVNSPCTAY
jgi:hypothetical protein